MIDMKKENKKEHSEKTGRVKKEKINIEKSSKSYFVKN